MEKFQTLYRYHEYINIKYVSLKSDFSWNDYNIPASAPVATKIDKKSN